MLCRNADTLKQLHDAEKKLKQQQTEAYVDLEKSAEEQKAGNEVLLSRLAVWSCLFACGWLYPGHQQRWQSPYGAREQYKALLSVA